MQSEKRRRVSLLSECCYDLVLIMVTPDMRLVFNCLFRGQRARQGDLGLACI